MAHHRSRRTTLAVLLVAALCAAGAAAEEKKPGPIQQPSSTWQTPGEIQKPGEIQQPKGTWQVPGEIQKPGEIQHVAERCRRRLMVAADALFAFDQATLTPQAEQTLAGIGPQLAKETASLPELPDGRGPSPAVISVEGHTDAKGNDDYNQKLSERRAGAVRDWLVAHGVVAAGTAAVGYGEAKPVAPNAKPDGSDDPEGRAKNRRVEVVITTCPAG